MVDVVLGSRILDFGLVVLGEATHIYLCNAQPTTYTEATSTFALGNKNFGVGNVAGNPVAGSPDGRQVTTAVVAGGNVTASGTASWWAITDNTNSRLLARGLPSASVSVTNGQTFSMDAFTIYMPASSTFQGPGDIATTANWKVWYSPARAFKTGLATQAVTVTFNDTTAITYSTLTNGTVDYSTYAADLATHGAPVTITKLWDQTGNGIHLDTLPATFTAPTFTRSALGSFAGGTFVQASAQAIQSTNPLSQSQPLSFSIVAKATVSSPAGQGFLCSADNTNPCQALHGDASGEKWAASAGGSTELATSDRTNFHAGQFILNGTSSNVYVDGVDSLTGVDIGSSGFAPASVVMGVLSNLNTANALDGIIIEAGVYAGDISSFRSALNSNQHTYYGF